MEFNKIFLTALALMDQLPIKYVFSMYLIKISPHILELIKTHTSNLESLESCMRAAELQEEKIKGDNSKSQNTTTAFAAFTEQRPNVKKGKFVPRGRSSNAPGKFPQRYCKLCDSNEHWTNKCRKIENFIQEKRAAMGKPNYQVSKRASTAKVVSTDFIVDSGCTQHMIPDDSMIFDSRPTEQFVRIADGGAVKSTICGSIRLLSGNKIYELQNVLCVPSLDTPLLSYRGLMAQGFNPILTKESVSIYKDKDAIFIGNENSFEYKIKIDVLLNIQTAFAASSEAVVWHRRLGHPGINSFKRFNDLLKLNLKLSDDENQFNCNSCLEGKQTRQPFPASVNRATRTAYRIHLDVCGPISGNAINNSKYFVVLRDEFSGYLVVRPLAERHSDGILEITRNFIIWIEQQSGKQVVLF